MKTLLMLVFVLSLGFVGQADAQQKRHISSGNYTRNDGQNAKTYRQTKKWSRSELNREIAKSELYKRMKRRKLGKRVNVPNVIVVPKVLIPDYSRYIDEFFGN